MAIAPLAAPNPAPVQHGWSREIVTPAVEHPATAAPRFEAFHTTAVPPETPHVAVESHHPEPVAPPRAAPAPVAPAPAATSSKSGKS
jgi:hypothetical protein